MLNHPAPNAITTLERRLHLGYARIEEEKRAGKNVEELEAYWIDLLHEYESLIRGDRLAA